MCRASRALLILLPLAGLAAVLSAGGGTSSDAPASTIARDDSVLVDLQVTVRDGDDERAAHLVCREQNQSAACDTALGSPIAGDFLANGNKMRGEPDCLERPSVRSGTTVTIEGQYKGQVIARSVRALTYCDDQFWAQVLPLFEPQQNAL